MSNIYSSKGCRIDKIILSVLLSLLMSNIVSAACDDVRYGEFLHKEMTAAGLPIKGANCTINLNDTSYVNNITDDTGWVSFCFNASTSMINMTCVKPTKYNAVLNDMVCPDAVYLDGRVSVHIKLTNTLGEPLEAQDCYIKVYNERGYLTEDLKTNLLYDNQTFLDGNGNYIRLAGVPITSSAGTLDYSWVARSTAADGVSLYRPFQNYTVRAECNGKVQNCTFQVVNKEPIHVDDDVAYLTDNMQIITAGIVVLLLGWFFVLPPLLKSLRGQND
jgi:hypothetical protein